MGVFLFVVPEKAEEFAERKNPLPRYRSGRAPFAPSLCSEGRKGIIFLPSKKLFGLDEHRSLAYNVVVAIIAKFFQEAELWNRAVTVKAPTDTSCRTFREVVSLPFDNSFFR